MVVTHKGLEESYFISSFISELKENIREVVRMFYPTSLLHAINLAKMREGVRDDASKKSNFKYGANWSENQGAVTGMEINDQVPILEPLLKPQP